MPPCRRDGILFRCAFEDSLPAEQDRSYPYLVPGTLLRVLHRPKVSCGTSCQLFGGQQTKSLRPLYFGGIVDRCVVGL